MGDLPTFKSTGSKAKFGLVRVYFQTLFKTSIYRFSIFTCTYFRRFCMLNLRGEMIAHVLF